MPISVSVTGSGAYTSPPGVRNVTPPSPTYIAKITYDGVNITPVVLFADATFTSAVNGNPGSCMFRVRDDAHQFTFEVGRRIELAINGLAEWTGYVSRVRRETAFPSGPATQTRFLVIEGVDINILFRKRIVANKAEPKNPGPVYKYSGTPTPDTTALTELTTNWLDLRGDDLDVSSMVSHVDDINVDQDTAPFAGAWTWEQAMAKINVLPAAVWYLNPERKLVWADVDTATAPFGLSDTPNNSTTYGYREMEITYDGSNLVNDGLIWGAGQGSPDGVFKRLQSPSSITAHGRWQASDVKTDIYKQASIDKVASTLLNGSPSSKRGHKDDKIAVTCTTYRQGLQAGMGVSFACNAYSFTDVLPVRQVTITFPSPTQPRYQLLLSHEIDTPWNITDVFHPKWTVPKWPNIGWYWATDAIACTSDEFTRTVAGGWGTGALGTWSSSTLDATETSGVDGQYAVDSWTAGSAGFYPSISHNIWGSGLWTDDFEMTARVYMTLDTRARCRFIFVASGQETLAFDPVVWSYNGSTYTSVSVGPSGYVENTANFTGSTGWYMLKARREGARFMGKIWADGATEPGWQVSITTAYPTRRYDYYMRAASYGGAELAGTVKFDYIKFCPVAQSVTDEFDRTSTGNFGTGPLGSWSAITVPYNRGTVYDNGSSGVFEPAGGHLDKRQALATLPILGSTQLISVLFRWSSFGYSTSGKISLVVMGDDTSNHGFTFCETAFYYPDAPGEPTAYGGTIYSYAMYGLDPVYRTDGSYLPTGVYSPDIQYRMDWEFTATQVRARVYQANGTVPDWQNVGRKSSDETALLTNPLSAFYIDANSQYGSGYYNTTVYIDSLTFTDTSTGASTSIETTPGEITASLTGNGSATIPLGPYFRGTTRIFKNGLIQRQGVDYTESPGAGTITFSSPTSTSDKIVAHFVAATPTNGGVSRRVF